LVDQMSIEPRDEREFFAKFEIFTPKLLPGVNVGATYRRMWIKPRTDRFVDTLSQSSGMSRAELQERLKQADEMTDLVVTAATRVNEKGDRTYSDVLARLVAAALIDEARIDPISYLMERIIRLDQCTFES